MTKILPHRGQMLNFDKGVCWHSISKEAIHFLHVALEGREAELTLRLRREQLPAQCHGLLFGARVQRTAVIRDRALEGAHDRALDRRGSRAGRSAWAAALWALAVCSVMPGNAARLGANAVGCYLLLNPPTFNLWLMRRPARAPAAA